MYQNAKWFHPIHPGDRMTNRRTSLPAFRSTSPRTLSPKFCNQGFLEEISEFDVEPPFLSPSSSSSAENSPRMLSPTHQRPASARPPRKQRVRRSANVDEDDSREPSPQGPSPNNAECSKQDQYFFKEKVRPQLSAMPQMRSFNIDCQGKIVDCGFKHGGISTRPLTPRSSSSRRATCPEIWLSCEAERRAPLKFILRIYGTDGKSTIIQQMRCHADVAGSSDAVLEEGNQNPSHTINFMMNDQEIELELIHGSALEKDPFKDIPTIFMVVYSVDSRDSFSRAAQILYRIYNRKSKKSPLLLIGNKIDLQRKRKITTLEGKMLAKIYKCGFVEISALLGMNMDHVWEEVVRKIQNSTLENERQMEKLKRGQGSRSTLTERIVKRGRQFAKSCEELVARIIEL